MSVLRHHAASLRPAGLLLALDFDLGASRAEPELPLVTEAFGWVKAAFRSAGANPAIGARLALLLAQAGLAKSRASESRATSRRAIQRRRPC